MSDGVHGVDAAERTNVEVAMSVLGERNSAVAAHGVDDDEDDFADDVVVFRPAFSRPVDTPSPSFSPSNSASSLHAMSGTSLLSAVTPAIPMNMGDINSSNTAGSSTGSSLSLVNKNKNKTNDPSIAYLASTLGLQGTHAGGSGAMAVGAAGGSSHGTDGPTTFAFDELESFLGVTSAPSRPPLPLQPGPPGLPPPGQRLVAPPPGKQ